MCEDKYQIIQMDKNFSADMLYRILPENILGKMDELLNLISEYNEIQDEMSLRDFKRLQELDIELAYISLEMDDNEIVLKECQNCVKITLHFAGFLQGKTLHDAKLYFHFCESDPLVWKLNPEKNQFEVLSRLPHDFNDKYDFGKDDFLAFCDMLKLNKPEIKLIYSPYEEE